MVVTRLPLIVRRAAPRGFSLVELLVVMAILALLAALLLPSIQQSREAARRATCQNNLKQIGVALLNYHDLNKVLPRGGWNAASANLSWSAAILPQLEESSLFATIKPGVPYTDPANLAAGNTVLPVFLCPTSPNPSLLRLSDTAPASGTLYARSDYGAMQGERGLRSPTATNNPERGAMIYASNIALKQITDGSSQTILIGEAPAGLHSIWISVANLYDQSAPINTLAIPANQYVFTDFGQEINSYHVGGAHALFADGSVHFLRETIDNLTLAAFCSRTGNEVVESFE